MQNNNQPPSAADEREVAMANSVLAWASEKNVAAFPKTAVAHIQWLARMIQARACRGCQRRPADERKAFEAHMRSTGMVWDDARELDIDGNEQYADVETRFNFGVWQARAALSPSPGVDAAAQTRAALKQTQFLLVGMLAEIETQIRDNRTALDAAPSPAASADEWMAEAERLVGKYQIATRNAEAYDATRYAETMAAARAALLAHLKARP